MTTPTWIGTSWKMNKLLAEAKSFASRLQECPPPPAVQRVVIPDSERRTHFNETDATVNLKVRSVVRHEAGRAAEPQPKKARA